MSPLSPLRSGERYAQMELSNTTSSGDGVHLEAISTYRGGL